MTSIAIIPARMGSARIPRKNLCEIEPGISLVQHAINCARFSGVVDEVIVSCDEPLYFIGAKTVIRPANISGPTADISSAVKHAVSCRDCGLVDHVLTLQPAVVARSPLIVRHLYESMVKSACRGALIMAETHRWIWELGESTKNDWHPGPYPRSQDSERRVVEINSVQITDYDTAIDGKRWRLPLCIGIVPSWAAALDIDIPSDLAMARDMWPWAKPRLETCVPQIHISDTINGAAA